MAPPSEVYRRVGDPAGLELGAGWVEVALTRYTMGGPTSTTRHRPRSGSLKTRPIKSVPSRVGEGRVAEGSGVGGGGRLDEANSNRGRGKWARVMVMRSEREETT